VHRSVEELPSTVRWLVDKAMSAPLPKGWLEAEDDQGRPYFFNEQSNQTQWDHPLDEHFRAMVTAALVRRFQEGAPAAAHHNSERERRQASARARPMNNLNIAHHAPRSI